MSTSAPFIAVMDADLQHDQTILPEMLARLKCGNLDIAVGTRNAGGSGMGEFSASRLRLSKLAGTTALLTRIRKTFRPFK
jgi:dolichol-phosphate mannosyltransferase